MDASVAEQDGQRHRGSPSRESELWCAYRDGGDAAARQELVLLHLGFAKIMAAKLYSRRGSNDVAFDDYMQFASVGLIESIDRYDPDATASFRTYAAHRIQGAILSGIEGLTERQRQLEVRRTLKRERLRSLAEEGEAQPEDAFARLASLAVGLALGFMLEDVGMYQAEGGAYGDNSYTEVEERQSRERLLRHVNALPERESKIIRYHYLQQIAFDEIAVSLGLTKGRVSQLHRRALCNLQAALKDKGRVDLAV